MKSRVLRFDASAAPRFPATTESEAALEELRVLIPRLRPDRRDLVLEIARSLDPSTPFSPRKGGAR